MAAKASATEYVNQSANTNQKYSITSSILLLGHQDKCLSLQVCSSPQKSLHPGMEKAITNHVLNRAKTPNVKRSLSMIKCVLGAETG